MFNGGTQYLQLAQNVPEYREESLLIAAGLSASELGCCLWSLRRQARFFGIGFLNLLLFLISQVEVRED
jgi:uncharacterized membrane protein YhhN